MRYKSNVGPHVQWRRNALGSSQPLLAKKLQIAGFDISRIGVSKIEARFGEMVRDTGFEPVTPTVSR